MNYDDRVLSLVFEKTDGRCHICRKKLCFSNYGTSGRRGAWHVDHSRPQAMGGTGHLNNLLPACISCNCSKQDDSTRSARAQFGFTKSPISKQGKERAAMDNGAIGAVGGALAGARLFGPPGFFWGGLIGWLVGKSVPPE